MTGTLTITAEDGNALAELYGLKAELELRANVNTEGSLIKPMPAEDVPPPPPAD